MKSLTLIHSIAEKWLQKMAGTIKGNKAYVNVRKGLHVALIILALPAIIYLWLIGWLLYTAFE